MWVASVEAKTFRDRLALPVGAGTAVAVLAVAAIWMFSGLGDSATDILDDMPEALSSLIGASGGGNYIVSELFSLIAPVLVLVVAISGGANAVAGEERDHTAGLLLAQPVTRRRIVVAKGAVMAVHTLIAAGLFLAGFLVASALFDTGVTTADTLATVAHMAVFGLAFGAVALALSAATGSVSTSLAVTVGLAVVTNLMATMLPLVDALAWMEKLSPWYYYDGSTPVTNGLDPSHLVVLVAIAVVAVAAAMVLVDRRDIGSGAERGLLSRIPALDRVTAPRVNGVFAKSLSQRTVLIAMVGGYGALMALGVSLLFSSLQDTLGSLTQDLPEGVTRAIGGVDMGTPVGWINAELLSILAPLALIGVSVTIGVAAVAGEQKRHTLGLLFALPVTRRRVVLANAAAMAVVIVASCALIGIGVGLGSLVADLGLGAAGIAAAMTHLALLAMVFGTVALAIGAVTTSGVALRTTIAAAGVAYVVETFLPLSAALEGWAVLSPWHYYLSSNPLANAFDVAHLAVLAGLSLVALLAATVLVERREVTT